MTQTSSHATPAWPWVRAGAPLWQRYRAEAAGILDEDERARFLDARGRPRDPDQLAWELLYRLEPQLYARLVAGERLHEGILAWLPARCSRVLEIGAGTGRLTLDLAARSDEVVAVEPAAGLREILERRLREAGARNVDIRHGFFDALPVAAAAHDLVVACSAFSACAFDDPAACLAAMESRCAPGGLVVIVWPGDAAWLRERGFEHVVFAGPMLVEYESAEDAVALARIFYPDAIEAVSSMGSRFVDFVTLGIDAPRDLCWKRVG